MCGQTSSSSPYAPVRAAVPSVTIPHPGHAVLAWQRRVLGALVTPHAADEAHVRAAETHPPRHAYRQCVTVNGVVVLHGVPLSVQLTVARPPSPFVISCHPQRTTPLAPTVCGYPSNDTGA